MKWKEHSALHKVVIVVGFLCAIASFIFSILDAMGTLTDIDVITKSLWCVFCLSQGILYRNTRRKLAVVWFVLGVAYFLMGISYLFI